MNDTGTDGNEATHRVANQYLHGQTSGAVAIISYMIDPLYNKIVAGLDVLRDGDKFEACANSLLREKYPYLTWVKGGNDAGFDGAGVAPDGKLVQLVATTEEDVIGNVTGSLRRAKDEGRASDVVLVATSRGLSPERKRNIEDRIKEFGKTAYPIEDQPTIAELIYHHPRWRLELLGIPGHPPPLSLFPVSNRTYLPLIPVGRDAELKRLAAEENDLVVFGQPGSGKTHLLAHSAKETGGLFLAATDRGAIADGIREQKPKWIIVDDAFSRLEVVRLLRQIRHDTGAAFRIMAACWPGQQDEVATALDALGRPPLEIAQLPQADIKAIIEAAGIFGPDSLLRELIHQADGKPGLAVTLAQLCLRQNVREVIAGRALARDVKQTLTVMAGKDAVGLLGYFALAGDGGLDLTNAAKAAGFPPATVRHLAETIGAAGVLQVVENNRLAVEPARLRQALVAEIFCAPAIGLDWQPLLEFMPDRSDAVVTVACAGLLGGKIDHAAIRKEILFLANTGRDFVTACDCYARLGRAQSLWVIEQFPHLVEKLADGLLANSPRESLPPLILADQKMRGGVLNTRERLKSVRTWIDAVAHKADTVSRRALLLEVLGARKEELRGSPTLLAGLAHVFSLRFEWVENPPGQSAVITISNGSVPLQFVPDIGALWKMARPLLEGLSTAQASFAREVIGDWIFPTGRLSGRVAPDFITLCKKFGAEMLTDLIAMYAGKWAMLRQFDRMADAVGIVLPSANPVAETLFPSRDELKIDPQREAEAKALAETWTAAGPKADVIEPWLICDAEAREAGVNYPNLGESIVSFAIAEKTPEPGAWLKALVERKAPVRLIWPFALRACREDESILNWFTATFAEVADYAGLAIDCLLIYSQPSRLAWIAATNALQRSGERAGLAVAREQISDETTLWLLKHGDSATRREVASSLWSAKPKGEIPEALREAWQAAVIEDFGDDYQWEEIAKAHSDLACAWLKKRINQTWEDRTNGEEDFTLNHYLPQIIDSLSVAQRREIIDHFTENNYHAETLANLVGGNLDLMRHALARKATAQLARSCLRSPSDAPKGWPERAMVLLDHGVGIEEVFWASRHDAEAWTGPSSLHYEKHRAAYAQFLTHADGRVRAVCEMGAAEFSAMRDDAKRRERIAAIKGRII